MLAKQPLLLIVTSLLVTSQPLLVKSDNILTKLLPDKVQNYVHDLSCRAYRTKITSIYLYNTLLRQTPNANTPNSNVADDLYQLIEKSKTRDYILAPQPDVSPDMNKNIDNMIKMEYIHRFAFYSSVAYCRDLNTAQNIEEVKVGNSKKGEKPVATPVYGYRITHWYERKWVTHYVAVNPYQRVIVLSFRGSNNLKNYIDAVNTAWIHPDAKLFTVTPNEEIGSDIPPIPKKARQFFGYNQAAAKQMKIGVAELLKQHQQHSDYAVVITGHSLGGVVAHLAATYARMRYRRQLRVSAVYTFGKPIFGNGLFADWTIQLMHPTPVIHVTAENDIVPVLWLADDPKIPEQHQMRHGKGTIEVYSYKPAEPKAVICRGHADRRCSTGQDCYKSTWTNHNSFVGMRISGRVCKLGYRPEMATATATATTN